jgi:hypothetical protein
MASRRLGVGTFGQMWPSPSSQCSLHRVHLTLYARWRLRARAAAWANQTLLHIGHWVPSNGYCFVSKMLMQSPQVGPLDASRAPEMGMPGAGLVSGTIFRLRRRYRATPIDHWCGLGLVDILCKGSLDYRAYTLFWVAASLVAVCATRLHVSDSTRHSFPSCAR